MSPFAVVTGASSGIGRELARVFEANGFDVLGVAEHDYDLATPDGVEALYVRLDRPVDVLALNAGISEGGDFATGDLDTHLRLVDLNVRGTVHLAMLVTADMAARGRGRVLFMSSMVAIMPGPFQATYNASKSFIQSFALALRDELKDSGVTVTVAMPGPTETNIFARAGQLDTRLGASDHKADPADVASDAFEALMAGKERVVAASLPMQLATRRQPPPPGRGQGAAQSLHHQAGLRAVSRPPRAPGPVSGLADDHGRRCDTRVLPLTSEGVTATLPTHHDRIAVTKDPELAEAMERVAPLVPAGVKPATLVRDLAVRGADALLADARDDHAALERLIARSTSDDPGYDRELLGDIDREAWGLEP